MRKTLTRGRRWLVVPVALAAAAGISTTGGFAVAGHSRSERVCQQLANKEARQRAAQAAAPFHSRRWYILQFQIEQTQRQEANHGCA